MFTDGTRDCVKVIYMTIRQGSICVFTDCNVKVIFIRYHDSTVALCLLNVIDVQNKMRLPEPL